MSTPAELLALKIQSIRMMGHSGYDISDDEAVLAYEPEDMEAYFEHARSDIHRNLIRSRLAESDLMTDRTCMSTLYPSRTSLGRYVLVYFTPIPTSKTASISKGLIQVPLSLCSHYSFSKRKYCADCINTFKTTKRCPRCPLQQYCETCTKELRCPECIEDKWCSACTSRLRRWTNYRTALQNCDDCPEDEYCEPCTETRQVYACEKCPRTEAGQLTNKSCRDCRNRLKCAACPEKGFCEICDKIRNAVTCSNCPAPQFCRRCAPNVELAECKRCPPIPEIIERCIIISQLPLSTDAKAAASTNIPRVKPSTGEYLEVGCLIQTFLDWEFLYNPLIHSMGSSYQVLTIEEAIRFFEDKDNNINETQMHNMDIKGKVAQYLGCIIGNVVRCERKGIIPGVLNKYEVSYRLVKFIPPTRKNRRRGLKARETTVISSTAQVDDL